METFAVSPSALRDYLFCPRKAGAHRSKMRDKNAPRSPAMLLSETLHQVLAEAHRPPQQVLSADDLLELLSNLWQTGYPSRREEDAAFDKAVSILRYYRNSKAWPQDEVLATEASMSCLITVKRRDVQIRGRADRIELDDDGKLEILDYKVPFGAGEAGSGRPLAEDLPSFVYFYLAWRCYRRNVRVREVRVAHLNLVTLHKTVASYDQRQIKQNKHALARTIAKMMTDSYEEARPSAACSYCPVKRGCPAWSRADLNELDNYEDWRNRRQPERE